jgi:hypothetical protein
MVVMTMKRNNVLLKAGRKAQQQSPNPAQNYTFKMYHQKAAWRCLKHFK